MNVPCKECISYAICIIKKEGHETFGTFFLELVKCNDLNDYLETKEDDSYEDQVELILNIGKLFRWEGTIPLTNNKGKKDEITL